MTTQQGAAIEAARELRIALGDHGVRRVSIELQPGRPAGGRNRWLNDRFRGVMGHHTAGPLRGDTPSLGIIKTGRSGIPGPLSNGYGGRDQVVRIITMGLANHPGRGGPYTLTDHSGKRYVVPADSGRPYFFGWEWENSGTGTEPWTDEIRELMGRTHAGTLDWLGAPVTNLIEHSTWAPRRKIDRYGYTARTGQIEASRYIGEEEMTPEQERQLAQVAADTAALRRALIAEGTAPGQTSVGSTIARTLGVVQGLTNQINRQSAALTGRIGDTESAVLGAVAALPPPILDDAQIQEVAIRVADALRRAGTTVDVDALAAALLTQIGEELVGGEAA